MQNTLDGYLVWRLCFAYFRLPPVSCVAHDAAKPLGGGAMAAIMLCVFPATTGELRSDEGD